MREAAEKWALVAMLLAAGVLLIGEVLDQEWIRAAIWALALGVVCATLLRRRRKHWPAEGANSTE